MSDEHDWIIRLPPQPSVVVASRLCAVDRGAVPSWAARNVDKITKLRGLVAPTAEDVEAILGDEFDTRLSCDGGHARPGKIVAIDINCGEFEVALCAECAREILKALE